MFSYCFFDPERTHSQECRDRRLGLIPSEWVNYLFPKELLDLVSEYLSNIRSYSLCWEMFEKLEDANRVGLCSKYGLPLQYANKRLLKLVVSPQVLLFLFESSTRRFKHRLKKTGVFILDMRRVGKYYHMRTMRSYSYYDYIREDEKMFANEGRHFEPLGAEGFNESFASVGKNIQYYTADDDDDRDRKRYKKWVYVFREWYQEEKRKDHIVFANYPNAISFTQQESLDVQESLLFLRMYGHFNSKRKSIPIKYRTASWSHIEW